MCIEVLLNKYHDKIVIGRKSAAELIAWLEHRVDTEQISPIQLGSTALQCAILNAVNSPEGKRIDLALRNVHFLAVKVVRNQKSNAYYEIFDRYNTRSYTNIYVLIEENSVHVSSNCNELFDELYIQKGIDESDFVNKTPALCSYLAYIAHLDDCK